MLITAISMQEKFQIHTEGSQMGKEFQHIKYECIFSFVAASFSFHLFNITQNKIKTIYYYILRTPENLQKLTISFSLSVWNNSTTTGHNFVEYDTHTFTKVCQSNSSSVKIR